MKALLSRFSLCGISNNCQVDECVWRARSLPLTVWLLAIHYDFGELPQRPQEPQTGPIARSFSIMPLCFLQFVPDHILLKSPSRVCIFDHRKVTITGFRFFPNGK
jgi:hypothetical protein